MYKITIPGKLPSLNQYIQACRTNAYKGNQLKQVEQRTCEVYIKNALRGRRIYRPVKIYYKWYEKDTRRDLDNISSMGRKIIQDALVATGAIANDGWKQIVGFGVSAAFWL